MKRLLFISSTVLLFFGSGCQDPCQDTLCLNGGACIEGTCYCPPRFSGANCEVEDLCHDVTCENEGICINGVCDCPIGYTGADCSQQETPYRIRIESITVTDFPVTNYSDEWDVGSGADMYLELYYDGSLIWRSVEYTNTVTGPVTYVPANPINIIYAPDEYRIIVQDADVASLDDYMGSILFTPYWDGNGFPNPIRIEEGLLGFDLNVTYFW